MPNDQSTEVDTKALPAGVVTKWTVEVEVQCGETGVHVRRGAIRIHQHGGVEPVVFDVPARFKKCGGWESGIADTLEDAANLLRMLPVDDEMTDARDRATEARK